MVNALLTGAHILFEETPSIDFSGLITALTTAITPAQLLSILSSVVGVGMGFVLMWFGVRKITRMFTSALSSGKFRM